MAYTASTSYDLLRQMVEGVEADLLAAETQLTNRAKSVKKSFAHGQMQAIVMFDAFCRSRFFQSHGLDADEVRHRPESVELRRYSEIRIELLGRTLEEWRKRIEGEMWLSNDGWWYPSQPESQADFEWRWQPDGGAVTMEQYDDATYSWTHHCAFDTAGDAVRYIAEHYKAREECNIERRNRLG
jgi:hypothetical protein